MPLTGQTLAPLVFADHLALFPTAVNANRQNAITGVLPHNVPEAFISALCEGYANALITMVIKDIGAGTLGVPPGLAPPVPVAFPAIPAAISQFIASQGLLGPAGALVAQSFIGNVLLRTSTIALLQMNPNPLMAIGTGIISPASNPDLLASMTSALNATLPAAFTASGKFAQGDVPGAPLNATLAARLPAYAAALAAGTASMTATAVYAGGTGPTTPVAGALNTGKIL
jgi:hypothetical protein